MLIINTQDITNNMILLLQAILAEKYDSTISLGNILTIVGMIISATITIVSLKWKINSVEIGLKADVIIAKTELENKISILEQQRLNNKEAILDLRTLMKEHITKDEIWQGHIDKQLDEVQRQLLLAIKGQYPGRQ